MFHFTCIGSIKGKFRSEDGKNVFLQVIPTPIEGADLNKNDHVATLSVCAPPQAIEPGLDLGAQVEVQGVASHGEHEYTNPTTGRTSNIKNTRFFARSVKARKS